MAGSKEGGHKAADTNRRKYGEDFYSKIGKLGGSLGKTGGFASQTVGPDGLTGKQRASRVGAEGGRNSKPFSRTKKKGLDAYKVEFEDVNQ